MKGLILTVLGVGMLTGTVVYINGHRSAETTTPSIEPVAEAVTTQPSETQPPLEQKGTALEAPKSRATQPTQMLQSSEQKVAKVTGDTIRLNQAIELLSSSQSTYPQKQAAWKELVAAGKLDAAITQLEQRMAAEPRVAEYPAALGQAYFKKCATIQDVREQAMLAMQADKLFDTALELDPSNWETRFTKAVAFTFWPASMNKGDEAIQHFQLLIQQQEAQTPQPQFADTYAWLGEQYQKAGRGDYARNVWERGASLFPNNDRLKSKLTAPAPDQNPAGSH